MSITYSGSLLTIIGGVDSGTATSGASSTLTDSTKSWTTDAYADRVVEITGGTGIGQSRSIVSNTATALTVNYAWETNPDATSTYLVSYNFDDVQAANDAGSWGVMTTQSNQHYIDTELRIGNTSDAYSYLADINKSITNNRDRFRLGRNGTLQLGEINESNDTKNGCYFQMNTTTTSYNFGGISQSANQCGNFRAYASTVIVPIFWGFYTTGTQTDMLVDIVDCITKAWGRICGEDSRLLRIKNFEPAGYGAWTLKAPFGSVEDVTVSQGTGYGLYYYGSISGNARIEEFNVSDVGADTFLMRSGGSTIYTLQVVNSVLENWTFDWGTAYTHCHRIYTANWHVTDTDGVDIDGATITLTDADETEIFSEDTGSDGKLAAAEDVIYAIYTSADGDTPDLQGPFTLTIEDGSDVYETVIEIDKKIDEEKISLGTGGGAGTTPTAEEIATEVWTHTTRTLTAGTKDTEIDAILEDTGTTIPASLSTIDDNVDAILVDTNDLQTNQGNWLTAEGFNTVVPPSVAQFNARTLANAGYAIPGEYDTDLSNIFTEVSGLGGEAMRGTDSVPTTPLLANDSRIDALATTAQLSATEDSIKGADGDDLKALSDDIDAIPTAVMAKEVESSVSVEEALKVIVSALGGKVSGAGTTNILFRDLNDTKNVIDATVDTNGNRTAVDLDVS